MKCEYFFREFQKLFFNHQKRKKIKKNILNLKGVAVLTKEQQKMVSGGINDTCIIRISYPNGNTKLGKIDVYGASSTQEISAAGNNECVSQLAGAPSGSRCFYDCGYDGFGQ
jgi:hypothetical protein